MAKNRASIFVKGLGNFEIMEVSPAAPSDYTSVGYIEKTDFNDVPDMQELIDECGDLVNLLQNGQKVSFVTNLMQSGKTEIDFMRLAKNKVHALRYYGPLQSGGFQYYAFEKGIIISRVPLSFGPEKRLLPLQVFAIKQSDLSYDVPYYYLIETNGTMKLDKLKLWICPRIGLNTETAMVLDVSGFARHGTLNSDYAAIWQQGTPAEFLRFDGTDDFADLGDVSDITTEDFAVEFWLRVPTDNGQEEECVSKKATAGASDVGWGVTADMAASNNRVKVYISDTTGTTFNSATGSVVANTWCHVFISFDRDGNGTIYINGAVSGTPTSIATEASTITNSASLYLARLGLAYGQVDLGDVRFFNFGAGGLPTDIATTIANHFSAERTFYNV